MVTREGVAGYLTEGGGMLLGTSTDRPRADGSTVLPPGATLVLYTDGLIEAPSHTIDDGLERLRRHAAALAHRPVGSSPTNCSTGRAPSTTTTTSPSSRSASAPGRCMSVLGPQAADLPRVTPPPIGRRTRCHGAGPRPPWRSSKACCSCQGPVRAPAAGCPGPHGPARTPRNA
ncbi:SpoIIE family protein phosphatase [Streptomyces thermocarboxydus]